jgi:hypothetical protein
MNLSKLMLACALVCALGGCKSLLKKREPVTTEASASPVAASASVALAPPAPPPSAVAAETDDAIPTSQDFEDEAFEKVTAANFKAELDRLKKEIEKK